IGANAAIFSVVRGVLLKPLVNRDADRLIYIQQSARGIGVEDVHFSVPELKDLQSRVKSISEFGDFSTIEFTMIGLGEPRTVRAGVVGGTYFDVMGLRPIRGRLLDPHDDGPKAAGAAVLTYRFWTTALKSDPTVIGRQIRLSDRPATVVGVLEPSVQYPQETVIAANVVTSPHHLDATMIEGRVHRMTELFGRLAPGATLDQARAELRTVHAAVVNEHPEAYGKQANYSIDAVNLRDQIISPARTILLVLLAASALVFIVACSNVANLILAQYAGRYSVRAQDVTVDSSLLVVGVVLALAAAILLAFVPRLPKAESATGLGLSNGSVRITTGTNRRLRVFAITQIAASFLLLAGAGALVTTLFALQRHQTGLRGSVLAVNVPVVSYTRAPQEISGFYREAIHRVSALPGVERVALGMVVPWRDPGFFAAQCMAGGYRKANGEADPRAQFRTVSPGFFATMGVRLIAGRDFNENDRRDGEKVVNVSQSLAQRMFPNMDALNRHLNWTDPVTKFIGVSNGARRIVGVVPDIDDEHLVAAPTMTVYHPMEQEMNGGRLFIHTTMDPYALVPSVTKVIRDLAPDQPVERPATLDDVRAEVLSPNRVNAMVFSGFAGVALAIAIVGVAGVLAFSVSARTREFGVRLAIGSSPAALLTKIVREGALIGVIGIVVGAASGLALAKIISSVVVEIEMPGVVPIVASACVLVVAAV